VTPAARRRALRHLVKAHRCSERRACGLVGLARSVARYRSRRRDDAELRARLRELAGQHRRFGYLRLHALLRWEGLVINRQKTYRLYKADDLAVRRRSRRRPPERDRLRLVASVRRNQRWSMDFASDALWTGRRFRCLCLFDDATRESPALLADFAIGGERVVRVLDELAAQHGLPEEIVMDNGPEFTGRALFAWSARTGVRLRFIQPGKPIQNAFVESFIGRFRDECLNQHWFGSLAEAARIIEAWRQHYNRERPHSALGYEAPERFARRRRDCATTSTTHVRRGPNFGGRPWEPSIMTLVMSMPHQSLGRVGRGFVVGPCAGPAASGSAAPAGRPPSSRCRPASG
jgi:putative transposase